MFVFVAMAEFAFVLLVDLNLKSNDIKGIDGPSGKNFNRVAMNTGNDAINTFCNVDPETPKTGHLAETKDRDVTEKNFWSKKYAIFYSLSLPRKIDCAGFAFCHLGYLIFNAVYLVCATKTFYKNN